MMIARRIAVIVMILTSLFLSACITDVWTGATLIYDRHTNYRKFGDFELGADIRRELYKDRVFKQADMSIDLGVMNGDVLLAGHVPTQELRQEAFRRVSAVRGSRRIFNQIAVGNFPNTTIQDNWISTKINSQIIAQSSINPHDFRVLTSSEVVYLMGDVIPAEADRVIDIARACAGVKRVVKLFKYYHLNDEPN
jgi:osmotically-inducible protein OsmY